LYGGEDRYSDIVVATMENHASMAPYISDVKATAGNMKNTWKG
jgi:hypothetical protein